MAIQPTQGVGHATVTMGEEIRIVKAPAATPVEQRAPQAPTLESRKHEAAQHEARLRTATQLLNDFMKHFAISLRFNIEEGQTIVKVMNKETGEVIRQIPSEEAIRISKALDTLQGLIIQKKV